MVQSDVERSIYIDYLRWQAIATVLRANNITIGGGYRIYGGGLAPTGISKKTEALDGSAYFH